MAHFKLDLSYLTQRVDSIVGSDAGAFSRDVEQEKIFLSEVLPVMIYHVDQEHQALHQLIKEHSWLNFVRVVKLVRGNIAAITTEILHENIQERDTKDAVERLKEAPLRLTLVLADVVRLYRSFLITEYLDFIIPEYYPLGKAYENYYTLRYEAARSGVPDLYTKEYMTNFEEEIKALCSRLFPSVFSPVESPLI